MNILVLNGSPRKNGSVAKLLEKEVERFSKKELSRTGQEVSVIWENAHDLKFAHCAGCMACRSKGACVLPPDDAHRLAGEIKNCNALFIGTPVYWGNMSGELKLLFDRLVYAMMGESRLGIPIPLHKGKKAVVVTACTTPFPFNYFCSQSTGAFRAAKEILKSSGFKIVRKVHLAGTKRQSK